MSTTSVAPLWGTSKAMDLGGQVGDSGVLLPAGDRMPKNGKRPKRFGEMRPDASDALPQSGLLQTWSPRTSSWHVSNVSPSENLPAIPLGVKRNPGRAGDPDAVDVLFNMST
mmetsp:Transcript_98337/g.273672  ORF Transcript_98337/g.273672 Transcript_98337/m.273672 type:complete len:112 (+) Transcript_98337:33-368(+)